MHSELRRRMNELSENCNKEVKNIKKNQLDLKTITTEMKNTLAGINSRLEDADEWISNLEDRVVEVT